MTESRRPVLLFVVNAAWFFRMHRMPLAVAACQAGFDVHVATAPDTMEDVRIIEQAGITWHMVTLRRGRVNVIEEWRLTRELLTLFRRLRPAIVHQVTIKPVMCGTLAARVARIPCIVNAISGLGFIFIARGWFASLRRWGVLAIYRLLFARRGIRVIFENSDDKNLFLMRSIVRPGQDVLIRGAGVDLERFRFRAHDNVVPRVLLPARMLWDKGVREFCEAAAILRAQGVAAQFILLGGLDAGNPSSIAADWLEAQQRAGHVEWWGHRNDMAEIYARTDVVCLPSYREGLPTVLLEAAACGCALVTTDVPGCHEVVRDGETGLLVPVRDSVALADALKQLIEAPVLRAALAERARNVVAVEFSASRVHDDTLALYREMLKQEGVI